MTEDVFDQSINNSFHGVGKRRTELSGMFLVTLDKLLKTQGYEAVTAWEDGESIIVCISHPEPDGGSWQGMWGIGSHKVRTDMNAAALEVVEDYIDNDLFPPPYLLLSDMVDYYVGLVRLHHPDTVLVMQDEYPKYWQDAVAEVGLWLEFGKIMPQWIYIQDIERVGDSLIFVHKPQRKRWKLGDPIVRPERRVATEDDLLPPGDDRRLQ